MADLGLEKSLLFKAESDIISIRFVTRNDGVISEKEKNE